MIAFRIENVNNIEGTAGAIGIDRMNKDDCINRSGKKLFHDHFLRIARAEIKVFKGGTSWKGTVRRLHFKRTAEKWPAECRTRKSNENKRINLANPR